jgi:uncharacterized Zn-binding protein involved in type VI secretion
MPTVTINSPKTPVTEGSNTLATATVPNICKMPGPPAPFVPTPLPNIGKSGLSPQDFSTTVKFDGNKVAIAGSTFKSMGDVASQGTGGGIVSNNVEGPTKFIAPGSMDTKVEGKNVQLLGDQMLNNCGPSGSPPNAACMMGAMHAPGGPKPPGKPCVQHVPGGPLHFPDTDEEFKDRRNALGKKGNKGARHEEAAAKHNESGILNLEGTLKREHGTPKSAVSGKEVAKKVRHTCKTCGRILDGEVEHAVEDGTGKRSAVEAKSGEDFNPAKSLDETERNIAQMESLKSLADSSGYGVIYKVPKEHTRAAQQILRSAKAMGFVPEIIPI